MTRDGLPILQALRTQLAVVLEERPLLAPLIGEDGLAGEELIELLRAVEAVQWIRPSHAARIESHDVETPVQVLGQEVAEAGEEHIHPGTTGTAWVDEHRADPPSGVARRYLRQRQLRGATTWAVVVQRNGRGRAEFSREVGAAGLPVEDRDRWTTTISFSRRNVDCTQRQGRERYQRYPKYSTNAYASGHHEPPMHQ